MRDSEKRAKMQEEPNLDSQSRDEEESSANLTTQQKHARTLALENPLVLHKIMSKLDYINFFKACRIVSKTWNAVASETMIKMDCGRVEIVHDAMRRIFHRQVEYGQRFENHHLLSTLTQISVPCTHFEIWVGEGSLANSDLQEVFRVYGKNIKTLELEGSKNSNRSTEKEILKQLLLHQASNVETLKVSHFDYTWEDDELPLRSLKNFDFRSCRRTALGILRSAPKLRSVAGDDLSILSDSKISSTSFKVLHVHIDQRSDNVLLTNLANAGRQIENLRFDWESNYVVGQLERVSESFQKVLNCTKDFLEHLILPTVPWNQCRVAFPKLQSLKYLKLGRYSLVDIDLCFPLGTNLNSSFPHLRTLDCSGLICRQDLTWDKYFPPDSVRGTLPSVSTIVLFENLCTEFWMIRLLELCPNFKKFVINTTLPFRNTFQTTLSNAFKSWKHLESIMIKTQEIRLGYFNLDSVFTGLNEDICDGVLSNLESGNVVNVEHLRTKPSICDLKELKYLTIVVDASLFPSSADWTLISVQSPQRPRPFSQVTLQVLKMPPKLKLTVQFDHGSPRVEAIQAAFNCLSPYVNFRHKRGVSDEEGN